MKSHITEALIDQHLSYDSCYLMWASVCLNWHPFLQLLATGTEVPIAYTIIIALFVLQHYGTHKIGFLLAPTVIIWLLCIGGLGIYIILQWNPDVIPALSPKYMYRFMKNLNVVNWGSLGGVFFCTTGYVYNLCRIIIWFNAKKKLKV